MKTKYALLAAVCGVLAVTSGAAQADAQKTATTPVTIDTFIRAEADTYFRKKVEEAGGVGRLNHIRMPVPIDSNKQSIIRMNRDTIYSMGVFDLTNPVTVIKPDTGDRFQSMVVTSEDHYIKQVAYGPGKYTLTSERIGTRYVQVVFRTLVNPGNLADVKAANALQDKITVEQKAPGSFDVPDWDQASLTKLRNAVLVLGATVADSSKMFGDVDEVEPIRHLIGTAGGFGGNRREDAIYLNVNPEKSDGQTPYALTVKEVPVDGFWSVSVYNADGFFEKNDLTAYSFNNFTASKNADGSIPIHFGGDPEASNYLPIIKGWNYTVRLYRPRAEILDGEWTFPEPQPAQ